MTAPTLLALAFILQSPGWGVAQDEAPETGIRLAASLISTQKVQQRQAAISSTDLVVFQDRLLLTFLDRWTAGSTEGCIRVMASTDGVTWTPQATIRREERDHFLVRRHPGEYQGKRLEDTPRFMVESDDKLTIRAMDARFNSRIFDTRRLVGWSTSDGTTWNYEGELNSVLHWGEQLWHGGNGYAYKYGGPCGEALGFEIMVTEDNKEYRKLYVSPGFQGTPERATLFRVAEDRLCCLMPIYGGGSEGVTRGDYSNAMLLTSQSPFTNWTWTDTNLPIWSPRVVSVPDVGFVAVVEIRSDPVRTSLCSLDIETGKLTELLTLGNLREQQLGIDDHEPLGAEDLPIGLAAHDGHVWVSYNRGRDVYVASIALQQVK